MNLAKVRFLVVDDDKDARGTVVDFLVSAGCEKITQCENGKLALEIIKKHEIDFVISDWDMPELDGLELLKQIRVIPEFKNLPFIIVTAPVGSEQLKVTDAAIEKVDAYLMKPFRSRTLIQKVKDVIYDRIEEMKKDVVLVDDDDDVRAFLTDALKELGYNPVSGFNNATDAYDYIEKHHSAIALVISDWEMPKMTGIEFLHKVRINRKLTHLPFIIITSQTSIEAIKIQKAVEAEVDNYLMKPFRMEALETKIKLVLAKAKIDVAITRGLESAAAALADGDFTDAERNFNHVETLDPRNVEALLGIGAVEMNRGSPKSFNRAIIHIEKAIACNPRYDRPHIQLALAYESSRSIDRSISILRNAVNHCFPLDKIHFHLGRLLIERGKRDEAIQNLEKAFELNPKLTQTQDLIKIAREKPSKKK